MIKILVKGVVGLYRFFAVFMATCFCFGGAFSSLPSFAAEGSTSLVVELETPAVAAGQALSLAVAERSFGVQVKGLLNNASIAIGEIIPLPYLGMAIVRTPEEGPKALEALSELPGVKNVALDRKNRLFGRSSAKPQFVPGDPLYEHQWYLPRINCPEAWDTTRGDSSMVVAVVDTGVYYNHPDLKDSMWTNPREIPNDGIDNDNNGIVDDYYGAAFYHNGEDVPVSTGNPDDVLEDGGHGTHVAGTIAAGINGIGVVGVAPGVKVMGVRCFSREIDDEGVPGSAAYDTDIIRGIDYLLGMKNRGVDIKAANFSLGGDPGDAPNPVARDAYAALGEAGIIPFIAAGNDANNNDVLPVYPANYDIPLGVTVGATSRDNGVASFSNYGAATVDIFAPGVDIGATVPYFLSNSGYTYMNGTSMATPVTLGMAMLIWGAKPSLRPEDVREVLLASGTFLESLRGRCVAGSMVDAAKAVDEAKEFVPTTPPSGGGGGGGCSLGCAPLGGLLLSLPLLGLLRRR